MEPKYYIAFDLGATSGRTILGSWDGHELGMRELTRFANGMIEVQGHLHWDIFALYRELIRGLKETARLGIVPESIGIDTWGVDYACVADDGSIIGLPYAYRDHSLAGAIERFSKDVMPAEELYAIAGIQHMDFNTVFQFNERRDGFALRMGRKILFLPDALSYLLTGKMVTEYTIASTGAIIDPHTRDFSDTILHAVGLDRSKFAPLVQPGHVIGRLTEEVAAETGLPAVPVIAVAGHDTASAVAAIPAIDENYAYLSSGTWSLMGIVSDKPIINEITGRENITNEGGVDGTVRVLKNITGMWIVEQCLKRWKAEGTEYTYPQMVEAAKGAKAVCIIDPDAPDFVAPADMPAAIDEYCRRTGQPVPASHGEYIRSIFESLAQKYAMVLDIFRSVSAHPIERLNIIGGGSKNAFLNELTEKAIGIPVVAGPAECTALGNLKIQIQKS